ncbi:hypothetical protein Pan216_38030 [Planctomycetes bacterium Pan216]|uniref:Transposase n=1 Tax=Kolteria novifilia TaxID=2527975 RepID=A0A518B7H3_9BACT|nr:hypothetical protein Pan216_38030 [Planctomycetes bacterium Pan216]
MARLQGERSEKTRQSSSRTRPLACGGNLHYQAERRRHSPPTDLAIEPKKYVVRLSEQEREELRGIVRRLSGSSQKVRRANILLQADADGPAWTDKQIAQAYHCRSKTVENVRQRLVERGFRETLDGKRREAAPRQKVLDGKQEAKVIATRLGPPPSGYANWTLRLLARKVVELEIVESVSHQTVMRTLKKTE